MSALRIGIDTGGTFTDFVIYNPATQELTTFKVLSTPHNPAEAILAGLAQIGGSQRSIVHGSTVATNTLLERKGASTALLTTAGFEDVLEIGRQNRPSLYDFFADRPTPLVPPELRYGLNERIAANGAVQLALELNEVEALLLELEEHGVESIAICTLFSFLHPAHEQVMAARLRAAGYFVSASIDVLPEFREYERASTTVINAYVSPVMANYLGQLEAALPDDQFQIMQSNGGSIAPEEARQNAVRCILSGPAGGLIGAQAIGRLAGYERLITFDMGGTSTDVALLDGQPRLTNDAEIGGLPVHIPMLDIHTVGAGGGSLAAVDSGGALRVGPQSAGADPGPACYGRGEQPTVTDANLVLGRIRPEHFLGGQLPLQSARAHAALTELGKGLGLSPQEAALGIIQVANAHMARALQVISVARGRDPRDFTLLSFGGAGGLHATDLARALAIPRVLIPAQAATLSALGMLLADVVKDYSLTVMLPGETTAETLQSHFAPLLNQGTADLSAQGVTPANQTFQPTLDMRYRGQSFELSVPFSLDFITAFHKLHLSEIGYANEAATVEIVTLRLRAIGRVENPTLPRFEPSPTPPVPSDEVFVEFASGSVETAIFDGNSLSPSQSISGPALIIKPDTTILLHPGDHATIDAFLNLVIEVAP